MHPSALFPFLAKRSRHADCNLWPTLDDGIVVDSIPMRRRARREQTMSEERLVAIENKLDTLVLGQDALALKQDALALNQDALARNQDALARNQDALALKQDALARNQDALARKQDALARNQDALAQNQDALAKNQDALARKDEVSAQIADLGNQMRLLHEDTIARIQALAPDFEPIRREFRDADAKLKEEILKEIARARRRE